MFMAINLAVDLLYSYLDPPPSGYSA